jgi:hypothetical protein
VHQVLLGSLIWLLCNMSIFSSDSILLSGQLLTATGNQLYLNSLILGSSNFDIPLSIFNTGNILYNDITGLSGELGANLQNTGQQAWNAANNNGLNLSGNLNLTGSVLYNDITGLNTNLSSVSGFMTGVSGYIRSTQNKMVSITYTLSVSATNIANSQAFLFYPSYVDLTNFTGARLTFVTQSNNNFTSPSGIMYIGVAANVNSIATLASYSGLITNNIYKGTSMVGLNTSYNSGFQPIPATANRKVGLCILISGGSGGSIGVTLTTYSPRIDLM